MSSTQPKRAASKRRPINHVEHQHQAALVNWAWMVPLPKASDVVEGSKIAHYLLAIPNGGARIKSEAIRLKAEGVKPGVSDTLLPLRRHGFAGLWLELKAPGKKPTDLQREWLERMALAGYRAEWADSWEKAACIIAEYVGVMPPVRTMRPPQPSNAA